MLRSCCWLFVLFKVLTISFYLLGILTPHWSTLKLKKKKHLPIKIQIHRALCGFCLQFLGVPLCSLVEQSRNRNIHLFFPFWKGQDSISPNCTCHCYEINSTSSSGNHNAPPRSGQVMAGNHKQCTTEYHKTPLSIPGTTGHQWAWGLTLLPAGSGHYQIPGIPTRHQYALHIPTGHSAPLGGSGQWAPLGTIRHHAPLGGSRHHWERASLTDTGHYQAASIPTRQ